MLKSTKIFINKAFIKEQEGAICKYIDRLDKINMYPHLQIIMGATNYLICFENQTVIHK